MVEIGIGRGLGALLPRAGTGDEGDASLRQLPIELIKPNPRQPRSEMSDVAIEGLAESIAAEGVLQPVLVRPAADGGYELIAGERRWRAAQVAGLESVPAIVRAEQKAESLELALVENMAREDLNAVDEARACAALVEEFGLSHQEVGKRVGRSRATVTNLIRLLDLPDEVIDAIESGALSEGHGRAILQVPDQTGRRRLGRRAIKDGMSVRDTEGAARSTSPVARRKQLKAVDPDQEDLKRRLEDELTAALGTDVRIRWRRRGGTVEVPFDNPADLAALVERTAGRTAA